MGVNPKDRVKPGSQVALDNQLMIYKFRDVGSNREVFEQGSNMMVWL